MTGRNLDALRSAAPLSMRKRQFFLIVSLVGPIIGSAHGAAPLTSSSAVKSDLKKQYAILKSTIRELESGQEERSLQRRAKAENKPIEELRRQDRQMANNLFFHSPLNACLEVDRYLGDSGDKFADGKVMYLLLGLALATLYRETALTQSNYPRSAWEPLLVGFESDVLRKFAAPDISKRDKETYFGQRSIELIDALNRYRREHDESLPQILDPGRDCGRGGDIRVTFVPNPRNAQVFIIPSLFYEYCIKQDIDPYDRRRCDRWRPTNAALGSWVSGEYHYFARWPDGVEAKGELRFEDETSNDVKIPIDRPPPH